MARMVRIVRTLAALSDGTIAVLALVCLLAALFAQGGRFSARLDLLTHFAPIWLAGALFVVDLARGQVFADREVECEVAARRPYGRWASEATGFPGLVRRRK